MTERLATRWWWQLPDRAVNNGDNGSTVSALEAENQLTLQEAEAPVCQEGGAEHKEEAAAAALHGVRDGI